MLYTPLYVPLKNQTKSEGVKFGYKSLFVCGLMYQKN